MKRKAPAKINVCLEVVRKLPNGFHAVRTVMMKLPRLHDVVEVRIDKTEKGIFVECTGDSAPSGRTNICYKAAELFCSSARKENANISIHITKNIPVAAGLGGGSSDAAAVLLCLHKLFDYPITEKKLTKIASRVGKDVPFFLIPKHVAYMEGMGEKIIGTADITRPYVLIIHPKIHIPTSEAYRGLDETLWYMNRRTRTNISALQFRTIQKSGTCTNTEILFNDFEMWAERKYPIIKEVKQAMMAFGARKVLMSGSGSSMFGIFPSLSSLRSAERILQRQYSTFFVSVG